MPVTVETMPNSVSSLSQRRERKRREEQTREKRRRRKKRRVPDVRVVLFVCDVQLRCVVSGIRVQGQSQATGVHFAMAAPTLLRRLILHRSRVHCSPASSAVRTKGSQSFPLTLGADSFTTAQTSDDTHWSNSRLRAPWTKLVSYTSSSLAGFDSSPRGLTCLRVERTTPGAQQLRRSVLEQHT